MIKKQDRKRQHDALKKSYEKARTTEKRVDRRETEEEEKREIEREGELEMRDPEGGA